MTMLGATTALAQGGGWTSPGAGVGQIDLGAYSGGAGGGAGGGAAVTAGTTGGSGGGGGFNPGASTAPGPPIWPTSDNNGANAVGVASNNQLQACGALALNCIQPPNLGVPNTPMAVMDPLTVAQMALSGMQLRPVEIGMVPSDVPGKVGLVGLPVWMWNRDKSINTNGPVTATATAGGVTVHATATLTSVTWNLGDGGITVCPGFLAPFTEYSDLAGDLPSPSCGYKYTKSSIDKPGGRFQVAATSAWIVNWVVVGGAVPAAGVIPMILTSDTSVQVGELQVLVTPG